MTWIYQRANAVFQIGFQLSLLHYFICGLWNKSALSVTFLAFQNLNNMQGKIIKHFFSFFFSIVFIRCGNTPKFSSACQSQFGSTLSEKLKLRSGINRLSQSFRRWALISFCSIWLATYCESLNHLSKFCIIKKSKKVTVAPLRALHMKRHKLAPPIQSSHQFSSAERSDYGFHNKLYIACRFTYSVLISRSNIPLRTCLSCVFTGKRNFDLSLLPLSLQLSVTLRVRARWEPAYDFFWHKTNYTEAFFCKVEICKSCYPIVS